MSEFILNHLRLINEASSTLHQAKTLQLTEPLSDRGDDLQRYVALTLLRTNEKLEEALERGEINIILFHFEKLAKLWLNIFQTNQLNSLKGASFLIKQSLSLFAKFHFPSKNTNN